MHDTGAAPVILIDEVTVEKGDIRLLDRISMSIAAGEHTAILGPNGSGKSTLVRLISSHVYPTGGGEGVRVFGQSRWNVFELRSRLGIVSPALQTDFAGEEGLDVLTVVLSGFFAARGLFRHHAITEAMRSAAISALEQMNVAGFVGRRMATLSTGEARRVLIARALAHRPDALLLDEPCAGLDPSTRWRFLQTLRQVAASGTTLILVTHHVEEILPEIGRVVMLRDGRILHDGDKQALLTDPVLGGLFDMRTQVGRQGDWFSARMEG